MRENEICFCAVFSRLEYYYFCVQSLISTPVWRKVSRHTCLFTQVEANKTNTFNFLDSFLLQPLINHAHICYHNAMEQDCETYSGALCPSIKFFHSLSFPKLTAFLSFLSLSHSLPLSPSLSLSSSSIYYPEITTLT